MKRNLLLLFFVGVFGLAIQVKAVAATGITDGFITTWMTDAANQSIVIPINTHYAGGYDYTVDWGDGSSSTHQTGNATHTYAAQGTHTVTITGDFPAIEMYNTISVAGNNQKLLTVEQWGNGTWKGMDNAFRFCQNLTTVPNANGPVFAANSTLLGMFYDCSQLNCDLNLWDLTNVTSISQLFHGATNFNGSLADWNVSHVTNMENTFEKALVFNRDISKWDVSEVTLMDNMFTNARAFNGDLSQWNVGKVTNMTNMFGLALAFNGDIGNWNVSNVTNMFFMFSNAPAFNQDLNSWDVSKVTDMSYMFQGDGVFNGDVHSWNVSSVTGMTGMFVGASAFNQDISGWDVRKVTSMADMFGNATSFNQDISGWQTNSLTQMDGIFYAARAFNQNIGNWDVSKVSSMNAVFTQATTFNQNIGAWQVGKVTDMTNMLDGTGISASNYESTLAGWAAQTVKPGLTLGAAGLKFCSTTARQLLTGTDGWQILGDRPVCLVPALPDASGIVYVDSAVAVPGNGSSWSNALNYLSNATESAKTNTAIKEVHIAKGSYYATGDKNLKYSDSAFVITRPGLKILGGYSSGGGQYDRGLYPTILSGDIGLAADTSDNTNNILVISDVAKGSDSLIIDGLTISGGKALFDFTEFDNVNYAGGVCMNHVFANTVLRNCIVTGNYGMLSSALSIAGPLEAYTDPSQMATPQIENCIFKNNSVIASSGLPVAIGSTCLTVEAAPLISYCDFTDNNAFIGGAFENSGGAPVFYNCRFLRNSALGMSVIYNAQNASSVFMNCAILDNFNVGYTNAADPENARLYSNAAIGNQNDSKCSLINTTMANNKSLINPATDRPLIFNISGSSSYITNSIIWGNTTNTVLDSLTSLPSKISYSLIQGLAADPVRHRLDGTLNSPVFADTAAGDFQLMTSSAAIDAGLNDSLVNAVASYMPTISGSGLDLAGAPRVKEGIIDLGAYEFSGGAPLPVTLKYFSGTLQNGIAELSWESGVEADLKAYAVEKSADGKSFQNLALVEPTGSNSRYVYKAVQSAPAAYYRLKMTDENGKSVYSSVIELTQNPEQDVLLYPNPARNQINIRTSVDDMLWIYNSTGGFIKTVALKAGVNKIDIGALSAGIYFGMIGGQKLQFVKQ